MKNGAVKARRASTTPSTKAWPTQRRAGAQLTAKPHAMKAATPAIATCRRSKAIAVAVMQVAASSCVMIQEGQCLVSQRAAGVGLVLLSIAGHMPSVRYLNKTVTLLQHVQPGGWMRFKVVNCCQDKAHASIVHCFIILVFLKHFLQGNEPSVSLSMTYSPFLPEYLPWRVLQSAK